MEDLSLPPLLHGMIWHHTAWLYLHNPCMSLLFSKSQYWSNYIIISQMLLLPGLFTCRHPLISLHAHCYCQSQFNFSMTNATAITAPNPASWYLACLLALVLLWLSWGRNGLTQHHSNSIFFIYRWLQKLFKITLSNVKYW